MDESSSSSSLLLSSWEVDLPGFRFHPTEEELLNFYLRSIVSGNNLHGDIIPLLNIYKYQPTQLPGLARMNGEREWYFFVPRERKHGGGGRPNRTTEGGFWKATGSDKKIVSSSSGSGPKKSAALLGLKKTLVFYEGRAPRGRKTDWVMNEFRLLPPPPVADQEIDIDIVLCKIYRKATSFKVLELKAAAMEEDETTMINVNHMISPPPHYSFCDFDHLINQTKFDHFTWTLDNHLTY